MVTGGAGFIGSHLVRRLVDSGVREVRVLDSLRYGDVANLGATSPGVRMTKHTLGSDDDGRLPSEMDGVDYLFHLAAEKHNQSKDSPARVIEANITGTHALLEAAADAGVRRVVFSSSLYAYGRMTGGPFVETEVPRPTTVYGMTKLAGEHLLWHFVAADRLEGTVLRYLFVYGPRQFAGQGYKSVILKSFERLQQGESPVVFGDGQQALDYVYVDDAVEATLSAMTATTSGHTLNVGSGQSTTVEDLVNRMVRVSGKSVAVTSGDADWTAGSHRVGDVSAIEKVLGWTPTTSLDEGLRSTWQWMEGR